MKPVARYDFAHYNCLTRVSSVSITVTRLGVDIFRVRTYCPFEKFSVYLFWATNGPTRPG